MGRRFLLRREQAQAQDPNSTVAQLRPLLRRHPTLVAENPVLPLLALEDSEQGSALYYEAQHRVLFASLKAAAEDDAARTSPRWLSFLCALGARIADALPRYASPALRAAVARCLAAKQAWRDGNPYLFVDAKRALERFDERHFLASEEGLSLNQRELYIRTLRSGRLALTSSALEVVRFASSFAASQAGPVASAAFHAAYLNELSWSASQLISRAPGDTP